MKTTRILVQLPCYLIACCSVVFGQANFLSRNVYVGVDAPVFNSDGDLLAGTNYVTELWGGQVPGSLAPTINVDRGNRREIVPFGSPGYFVGTSVVVPSVPGYGFAWLQVRAWDARLGATYEDVVGRGLGGYGESPLLYAQGGSRQDQFPLAGPLVGLQSFSLRPLTTAVLMRSARLQGNQVVVEWHPGFMRYQFQQTATLGRPW